MRLPDDRRLYTAPSSFLSRNEVSGLGSDKPPSAVDKGMDILYQNLKKEDLSKNNDFKSRPKSKNKKTRPKFEKRPNSENDTPAQILVITDLPVIETREPFDEKVQFAYKSDMTSSLVSR